jgi:hypothetical protein
MLPGTSHFPQIERADDVNAAIARFTMNEQLFPGEGPRLT